VRDAFEEGLAATNLAYADGPGVTTCRCGLRQPQKFMKTCGADWFFGDAHAASAYERVRTGRLPIGRSM